MQPESVSDAILGVSGGVSGGDTPGPVLTASEQSGSVFAGSGDSLAAAMLAEYFSEGRARAMDPSDILRNPGLVSGLHHLYLISVSGRTSANIRAARRFAGTTVAITADPGSRLARAAGAGSCR